MTHKDDNTKNTVFINDEMLTKVTGGTEVTGETGTDFPTILNLVGVLWKKIKDNNEDPDSNYTSRFLGCMEACKNKNRTDFLCSFIPIAAHFCTYEEVFSIRELLGMT